MVTASKILDLVKLLVGLSEMTLKATQGQQSRRYLIDHVSLPITVL